MAVPLQIRALRAVKARLEAIAVASGYLTDAGQRVYLGRRNLEETDCPCIIVTDAGDLPADGANNAAARSMQLTQTIYVDVYGVQYASIEEAGISACEMRADAKRAMFPRAALKLTDDDGPIGGVLNYGGAALLDAPDGSVIEGYRITATVTIAERYGAPDEAA